jgi:hypothetical protein
MSRDLQNHTAIVIKGGLFLVISLFASTLLLIEHWSWRTFLLLTLALWGFCRFYFFAFETVFRKEGHFDPASAAASVERKSRSPLLNQ